MKITQTGGPIFNFENEKGEVFGKIIMWGGRYVLMTSPEDAHLWTEIELNTVLLEIKRLNSEMAYKEKYMLDHNLSSPNPR